MIIRNKVRPKNDSQKSFGNINGYHYNKTFKIESSLSIK